MSVEDKKGFYCLLLPNLGSVVYGLMIGTRKIFEIFRADFRPLQHYF